MREASRRVVPGLALTVALVCGAAHTHAQGWKPAKHVDVTTALVNKPGGENWDWQSGNAFDAGKPYCVVDHAARDGAN